MNEGEGRRYFISLAAWIFLFLFLTSTLIHEDKHKVEREPFSNITELDRFYNRIFDDCSSVDKPKYIKFYNGVVNGLQFTNVEHSSAVFDSIARNSRWNNSYFWNFNFNAEYRESEYREYPYADFIYGFPDVERDNKQLIVLFSVNEHSLTNAFEYRARQDIVKLFLIDKSWDKAPRMNPPLIMVISIAK